MDGDNYKLEDANELKLNADYDDEDGYMDGLTVTSVYNKSGKAYVTFSDSKLTDVKFNGVTIIDTRSESDIDNSAYPTEIISIADLKDAVETPCVVKADVYFDDGVTFLAVTSVDGKGQNAVDQAEDDGYNFVGDITVNDSEVTATGNNSYATVNPSVDASTAPYIADLARFLGGLYRSGSASTIVFNGKTYEWNTSGTLAGSNWTEGGANDTGKSLVKAIDTKWGTVSAGNEYSVALTVDGVDMTYTVVIPA